MSYRFFVGPDEQCSLDAGVVIVIPSQEQQNRDCKSVDEKYPRILSSWTERTDIGNEMY